jgi:hypothetical protein
MNQNEAFTDEPPAINGIVLLPFNGRVANIINHYVLTKDGASDLTSIGAYVILGTKETREALQVLRRDDALTECDAVALELTEDEFQAVSAYIGRVLDRRAAAAVEVAESPGKQD